MVCFWCCHLQHYIFIQNIEYYIDLLFDWKLPVTHTFHKLSKCLEVMDHCMLSLLRLMFMQFV